MRVNDLRSGICPSCDHNEIIEASPGTYDSIAANAGYVPLGLAQHQKAGFREKEGRGHPFGQLWTYTCRRCGLTQWVASKPEDVPIGPEHGTRLISGPPPQPFR
jgi:hypothetical protein